MIYLGSEGERGLIAFLGLSDENIDRIEKDDVLVANFSNFNAAGLCKYGGLFLIYPSENGELSPHMVGISAALKGLSNWCAVGCTYAELQVLRNNQGVFSFEPKDKMPLVERVTVLYCKDQKSLIKSLRDKGWINNRTEVQYIPRNLSDN
jgi:hypothetical protein